MPARDVPAPSRRRRLALGGALASVGALASAAAATAAAATYFARKVVTPDHRREDDVEILAVGPGGVTLQATPDTVMPGRYGLWLAGGTGHARLGEVLERDESAGTVTRAIEAVDRGRILPGPARWNQYHYIGNPLAALGLAYRVVQVSSEVGDLPCWLVPGEDGGRWAILIHGRGATRDDPDAPRSPAGRYHLGDREWLDVEAALEYAAGAGAGDVVLIGWSMGAAIALQTLTRSPRGAMVSGLVLDAPVLDWRHVLGHHARLKRVPAPAPAAYSSAASTSSHSRSPRW
jgi:hypothetical protein